MNNRVSLADTLILLGGGIVAAGMVYLGWIYFVLFIGAVLMGLGLAMAGQGK